MTSEPIDAVQKARAELVAALSDFEDAINVKKRFDRARKEAPAKVYAALGTAGAIAAGILTLVVVGFAKKKK